MRFATVRRRALDLSLIVTLGPSPSLFAAEPAEPPAFKRKALEEHLRYLSSDELSGRGNGSSGLEEAALYIRKRFETLGLEPAGEGGTYFQTFRVMTGQEIGRHTAALMKLPDGKRTLTGGSDFEPLTFSASGEIEAPVIFAGYGVTAPEHDYDDYAGIDVRGKIVLLLRYAPVVFGEQGWHATFVRKAENAASHGAAALMIVNGPRHHRDDRLVPFGIDIGAEGTSIPVIHLKREHAEALVGAGGRTLLDLQAGIDEDLTPRSFAIENAEVALTVDVRRSAATVSNVLALLSASGDTWSPLPSAMEHIVIGAHYDHLGLGEKGSRDRRARGSIHNGADDNASGVAGVLELARVFSQTPNRPRGVLFAAFAGEELGLKGSSYYTAHPTLPLKHAVAMINLDMIGRLRHDLLYLGGIELLPELTRTVEVRLEEEGLAYSGRFTAEEASDHAPFIRAGVPSLFFFTGLHGDYHKPTDDAQFINFEGMERVLRAGYRLSDYMLRTKERPTLVASSRATAREGGAYGLGKNAAYFGIGVDPNFAGEGVRFAYVAHDGPAAKAGLEAGDVLLELDGRVIGSGERAAVVLQHRRPGETVSAKIRRKDTILEVTVRLASWP
ncbi:MAG: M28 family peptidase [Vicinamibacteria bacterium]